VAMSFVVASLRCAAALRVRDVANVATSFPGFVALARAAGLQVREMS
jgi:5-enolpyruvylshikimate-3-phosphate synthase